MPPPGDVPPPDGLVPPVPPPLVPVVLELAGRVPLPELAGVVAGLEVAGAFARSFIGLNGFFSLVLNASRCEPMDGPESTCTTGSVGV